MWKPEHRLAADRRGLRHHFTDAERAIVEAHFPPGPSPQAWASTSVPTENELIPPYGRMPLTNANSPCGKSSFSRRSLEALHLRSLLVRPIGRKRSSPREIASTQFEPFAKSQPDLENMNSSMTSWHHKWPAKRLVDCLLVA